MHKTVAEGETAAMGLAIWPSLLWWPVRNMWYRVSFLKQPVKIVLKI